MIEIKLIDDEIKLKFGGESFSEILAECKKVHLQFNPKDKSWNGENSQIYNIIPQLQLIEEFQVSNQIMEMIKPKLNVKFVRRQFKRELLKAEPLGEYQIEGIKKFIHTNAIINGDDPGLGKTFMMISALSHLYELKEIEKILIITVPEVTYNWKREFLMFSNFREEDILIANKYLRNPFDYKDKKIIICSYSSFLLIENHYFKLKNKGQKVTKRTRKQGIDFSLWSNNIACVCDEGHKLKGLTGVQSKTILKYRDSFSFKYILSGTPFPNNISEIYNLLRFLDDSIIYSDYNTFLRSIANVGNRFSPMAINYFYENKVKLLMEKISPYIFRRFKYDVLPDLPSQTIKRIYVEMNQKQKIIYQRVISEKLQALKEDKGEILVTDVMNSFPYLTLACSEPSILSGKIVSDSSEYSLTLTNEIQKLLNEWKFIDNSKLEILKDVLAEHKDEKIIIWSTHPITCNLLGEYFKDRSPIVIHGKSHEKVNEDKNIYRDRLLESFKASNDCNLAILNPSVMGTGVNIKEATVSICWDRSYNFGEWTQLLGRNLRANSTESVIVYLLLLDQTLESGRQDRRLSKKEELNNNATKFDTLSQEEWKSIFEGGN